MPFLMYNMKINQLKSKLLTLLSSKYFKIYNIDTAVTVRFYKLDRDFGCFDSIFYL